MKRNKPYWITVVILVIISLTILQFTSSFNPIESTSKPWDPLLSIFSDIIKGQPKKEVVTEFAKEALKIKIFEVGALNVEDWDVVDVSHSLLKKGRQSWGFGFGALYAYKIVVKLRAKQNMPSESLRKLEVGNLHFSLLLKRKGTELQIDSLTTYFFTTARWEHSGKVVSHWDEYYGLPTPNISQSPYHKLNESPIKGQESLNVPQSIITHFVQLNLEGRPCWH